MRQAPSHKPSIARAKAESNVRLTFQEAPAGETHGAVGRCSRKTALPATMQRIWSARGLRLRGAETFKPASDPRFEEKPVDLVGMYLNPPENAIVLCVNEES